jgi:hypothetical protein
VFSGSESLVSPVERQTAARSIHVHDRHGIIVAVWRSIELCSWRDSPRGVQGETSHAWKVYSHLSD